MKCYCGETMFVQRETTKHPIAWRVVYIDWVVAVPRDRCHRGICPMCGDEVGFNADTLEPYVISSEERNGTRSGSTSKCCNNRGNTV